MLCWHSNTPVIVCLSLRIYPRAFQAAVLSSAHTVLEAVFLHLAWHRPSSDPGRGQAHGLFATSHRRALKPALSC